MGFVPVGTGKHRRLGSRGVLHHVVMIRNVTQAAGGNGLKGGDKGRRRPGVEMGRGEQTRHAC